MVKLRHSNKLETAVWTVSRQLDTMSKRSDWTLLSEELLWRELVSCMLGSMVSFEHAQSAVDHLWSAGLLDINKCLGHPQLFELMLFEALSKPIYLPETSSGIGRKYRYPKLRANHIRRTAEAIYQLNGSIKNLLYFNRDSRDTRMKIVRIAIGIGPKQASLFLRNIGYADNLAILDRHVLQYMFLLNLLPEKTKEMTSLSVYIATEDKLRIYAKRIKTHLSRLDTAIWVVMRVFQKEFMK